MSTTGGALATRAARSAVARIECLMDAQAALHTAATKVAVALAQIDHYQALTSGYLNEKSRLSGGTDKAAGAIADNQILASTSRADKAVAA